MSRPRPALRGASAGFALAAAGIVYSRFGRCRPDAGPADKPARPPEEQVRADEIAAARSQLAEALARRAGRPGG